MDTPREPRWTPAQQERVAQELAEIEQIAGALHRAVGNESTLELQTRLKHLKLELGADAWAGG